MPQETLSPGKKLTAHENEQLLHLIKDCSDNLRHAKSQQWQAGNFTILIYAALVLAAREIVPQGQPLTQAMSSFLIALWSVLIVATGAIGVWMVWDFQTWMQRLRTSLSCAEGKLSIKYRDIASSMHGDDYLSLSYRSSQTRVIIVVIVIGGLIAAPMSAAAYLLR
jgi:hypothetical protein